MMYNLLVSYNGKLVERHNEWAQRKRFRGTINLIETQQQFHIRSKYNVLLRRNVCEGNRERPLSVDRI